MLLRSIVPFIALSSCTREWSVAYDQSAVLSDARDWRLQDVEIVVPQTLTVSEANSFAPDADIVWRGEPEGDRRAQVQQILEAGIRLGASGLRGRRPIIMRATLVEFHSVTPRAVANAPGAVHNISFDLQVADARTGDTLTETARIEADLAAFVGDQATEAARQGQTQRARVTNHIAAVTRGWLGLGPDPRRTFREYGR
ncbi:DUF6778 family protein [Aestuariibius sp. 2305UL40-4]|uniref:DUF6778 family protein n=1 Tax=Aestuariibius violaceus TaxID=3234132 RepID=UPI00345E6462